MKHSFVPCEELDIIEAIEGFALEMREAMLNAYEYGKVGWNDKKSDLWEDGRPIPDICARLKTMADEKFQDNEVDAANYLMMLWRFRRNKK